MNQETILAQANKAFRAKKYEEAITLYQKCLSQDEELRASINFNINLAKEKLNKIKIGKNVKKIVVYTCLFGNYESVKEPAVIDPDVEYILFTDNKQLTSKSWRIVFLEENHLNSRRASRAPKFQPHKYLPKHDFSIYIDSSLIIKIDNVRKTILDNLKDNDIAAYPHYQRDCIYEELNECLKLGKARYNKTELIRSKYKTEGFPEHFGLLENAFIIRRNTKAMQNLGDEWGKCYQLGEERDQFYLMYLLWKNKISYSVISNSNNFRNSPYVDFIKHNAKTNYVFPVLRVTKNRFAVAVHVYYKEMWSMLVEYINNVKDIADIYVTCRSEIFDELSVDVNLIYPDAEIIVVDNLGMDVLPFLYLCREKQLYLYDGILKLHTKNQKSKEREHQGRIILDGICGNKKLVNDICATFTDNTNVGMVGAAFQVRSANALMYGNRKNVNNILKNIDINLRDWPLFCGTMFWISGKILNSLLDYLDELILQCKQDAYLVRTGGDGTTAHALERIFGALPLANNLRVYVTERVGSYSNEYIVLPIEEHGLCQNALYLESMSTYLIDRIVKAEKYYDVIAKKGNFNKEYYIKKLGSNFVKGMDLIYHFVLYGDLLGVSPAPDFDVNYYLIKRDDVERKGICSYAHYINNGKKEGMISNPTDYDWLNLAESKNIFDPEWYISKYHLSENIDAKMHYLDIGIKNNFATSSNFDPKKIPITWGGEGFYLSKSCIFFLKYYYRDEAQLYAALTRAQTNGDDYFIEGCLHLIKTVYGETRAALEAFGSYYIIMHEWNKALIYLSRFWEYYQNKEFTQRHRNTISKYDRPTNSKNGKFPLCELIIDHEDFNEKKQKICIYTTLFGGIDDLLPIVNPVDGVDFICFTDRERNSSGWKQKIVNPNLATNNLNAKIYKVLPHKFLNEYSYSLFVDANTLFLGKLEQLLGICLANGDFVMWQHPLREDVYFEGAAIIGFFRHEPIKIINQLKDYADRGLPHSTGLLEASFIWRRHAASDVVKLMENWWEEINNHSSRDQLSLGYLIWRDQYKPKILSDNLGTSRNNDFFLKISHKHRDQHNKKNVAENIKSMRNRDIVFLFSQRYRETGSTVMRGEQLSSMVHSYYEGKRNVNYTDNVDIKNKIIILTKGFLKSNTPEVIEKLAKTNFLIADFVDDPPALDKVDVVHALMASSLCGFRDYLGKFHEKPAFHVTHHVDIRLAKHMNIPDYEFRAGYFGELVNTIRDEMIDQYVSFNLVDTSSKSNAWLDNIQNFNFHYATRKTRGIDGAKPFLKGFIAAHCGANMMIQKSAGDARYYLGYDYPYLLPDNATEQQILFALEEAYASYGTQTWRYGLEIMQDIKRRSSNEHVLFEFNKMIQSI